MCGLAGFYTSKNIDTNAALRSLHHRGPNSCAALTREFSNGRLTLAHTRLSIIDLSDNGQQPMSEGRVHIVFNGEVYNFRELRQQFLSEEAFVSGTDTEVVLKLYKKLGCDFVNYLNGDFALAILDEVNDQLLVYRDRLGVKPLYFLKDDSGFFFASEIKTFLAAGLKFELDHSQIGAYLTFKYSPEDNTLFKGVKRVKAGHYLTFDLQKEILEEKQYWNIQNFQKPYQGSYQQACEDLYRLMEDSVRLRLIADVPISNYLSGGVDSSILAHFLRKENVTHYCAVKNLQDLKKEGTTSDGKYAQQLAHKWQLRLEKIPIGSEELNERQIGNSVFFNDDLIADGSQIPSMLIAEKAAQKHRVVLSGMGADELFLGYNGHVLSYLSLKIKNMPGGKSLATNLAKVDAGRGKFKAYRRYLQKLGRNFGTDFEFARYSIVGDMDSVAEIWTGANNTEEVFSRYFAKNHPEEPFKALFRFEADNFLQKNLHYLDKSSMAFSLESRVPFLDHRVVEFAAALPVSWNISSMLKQKRILKDTFKEHLPAAVLNRRKAGFGMPLRSLLSDEKRFLDLIDLDFFANFEGFSADGIMRLFKLHQSGVQDQSALLYSLISFRMWYKQFFENPTPWNNLYRT